MSEPDEDSRIQIGKDKYSGKPLLPHENALVRYWDELDKRRRWLKSLAGKIFGFGVWVLGAFIYWSQGKIVELLGWLK